MTKKIVVVMYPNDQISLEPDLKNDQQILKINNRRVANAPLSSTPYHGSQHVNGVVLIMWEGVHILSSAVLAETRTHVIMDRTNQLSTMRAAMSTEYATIVTIAGTPLMILDTTGISLVTPLTFRGP